MAAATAVDQAGADQKDAYGNNRGEARDRQHVDVNHCRHLFSWGDPRDDEEH